MQGFGLSIARLHVLCPPSCGRERKRERERAATSECTVEGEAAEEARPKVKERGEGRGLVEDSGGGGVRGGTEKQAKKESQD